MINEYFERSQRVKQEIEEKLAVLEKLQAQAEEKERSRGFFG